MGKRLVRPPWLRPGIILRYLRRRLNYKSKCQYAYSIPSNFQSLKFRYIFFLFFFLNCLYAISDGKHRPLRSGVHSMGGRVHCHIIRVYLKNFRTKVKWTWHIPSAPPPSYWPENKNKPLTRDDEQVLHIRGQNSAMMSRGDRHRDHGHSTGDRGAGRHAIKASVEATPKCRPSITSLRPA